MLEKTADKNSKIDPTQNIQHSKNNLQEPQSIEDKLLRLQTIVSTLETGNLSLEASLKAFEEGIHLTHDCQELLENAEQRLNEILTPTITPAITQSLPKTTHADIPAKNPRKSTAKTKIVDQTMLGF